MIFTSLTFGLFLTLVFAAYWALKSQSWRNALLVAASYFFYGWWDWRFCLLIFASSMLDFLVGLMIGRSTSERAKKALLLISLSGNLGLLGFFKYFGFFAENAQTLARVFGWELSWTTLNITLPVGISFYTFQTLSYTIDVYRGRVQPTGHLINYLAYVSFFPQLVAGPIERATHFLPQFFSQRQFDADAARDGLRQMLWGAFKKLVIADGLAQIVDPAYGHVEESSGAMLAIATVLFAWQIYCDFSGYSDIAIGCAKLFGFRLMRNFAYPGFSQSPAEYWRRWHISLATWFRDYVYVPLGGNHGGRMRHALTVLATFSIGGLWHGASWNFVIWGALNGLFSLPEILWPSRRRITASDVPGGYALFPTPRVVISITLTFLLLCIPRVFFRAESVHDAWTTLTKAVNGIGQLDQWLMVFSTIASNTTWMIAIVHLVIFVAIEWLARDREHPFTLTLPSWVRWSVYTAIVWDIICFSPGSGTEYIYFQF